MELRRFSQKLRTRYGIRKLLEIDMPLRLGAEQHWCEQIFACQAAHRLGKLGVFLSEQHRHKQTGQVNLQYHFPRIVFYSTVLVKEDKLIEVKLSHHGP